MENYIAFKVAMYESLKDHMNENDIIALTENQWGYLKNGVRDVRICDTACVAWTRCGGEV